MTVRDLTNIYLRLEIAEKGSDSELVFDPGDSRREPFAITGIHVDEDGDICLESDVRAEKTMLLEEIARAVEGYGEDRKVYFISIDEDGERELYNIKDGGTPDRNDPELRLVSAADLLEAMKGVADESILYFESGTINFTINSVYLDDWGCLCLESNEIMELDNYPVSILREELSGAGEDTQVYFYDDDSKEYFGIYTDERRVDDKGDLWINIR